MKVLLSIKPGFAEKIFEGTKKYEFRRAIFKNPAIKKVVVYASSPVRKVIGEFEIESILIADVQTLWNKTRNGAGISAEYFFDYFANKDLGYAIKIKKTCRYTSPKCLKQDYGLVPPQSFAYLH